MHCLLLEPAKEEPPLSILISCCCLKCHGCCGSLGGLWWREEIILSFCFVCAAPGIWVLTRAGCVSIAVVQTISITNCMCSGGRDTLQSWMLVQRKALLCDVSRNSQSALGTISTAFCGVGSFLSTLYGLLALVTCGLEGAGLFWPAHSLHCVLSPELALSFPCVRMSPNRVCTCCSLKSKKAAQSCRGVVGLHIEQGLLQPHLTSAQILPQVF